MLSRKSKDKTIKEGVVGKYVKKDTPPEIPSNDFITLTTFSYTVTFNKIFNELFAVINVWTIDNNKSKSKSRRNSQQIQEKESSNTTNDNIIQATNQKFGSNGKITVKPTGLGHEGKYTPK